jgi:hypothetical protein
MEQIEHRLFSFITINWRRKPLRSYRTIVHLIAGTTTTTGLKMRAEVDENKYPKGLKVSSAGRCQSLPPLVPRRLELHDYTKSKKYPPKSKLTALFMDRP